jgi:hypothetical protein
VGSRRGMPYPPTSVKVTAYEGSLEKFVSRPEGLLDTGPSDQLRYLADYLTKIGCRAVAVESHYIDRDYIDDVALFYSRSLRSYPNFCTRLNFFRESFDKRRLDSLIRAGSRGGYNVSQTYLQERYLGYCIVRPLPGYPVGRTVLATFPRESGEGFTREYACVREYEVNFCGFPLTVSGLAFQQQDQGVSACATTAIWSAVNCTSWKEDQKVATPAEITQLASKYLLLAGRALPSEGLGLQQISEAIRGAGLAPICVRSDTPTEDRAQLLTYIQSGFAPVLCINPLGGAGGHAVCGVGFKRGTVEPRTNNKLHFTDASTSIQALYIHDDRLGPYAMADIYPFTVAESGAVRTALRIRWPRENTEYEHALLEAIVVPVPLKVRLSATRLREVGLSIAEFAGQYLADVVPEVILACRYITSTAYKRAAFEFPLTPAGLRKLLCSLPLSRYLGIVEISSRECPLFDVVLDTTETNGNPSVLACVARVGNVPKVHTALDNLATPLAGAVIR